LLRHRAFADDFRIRQIIAADGPAIFRGGIFLASGRRQKYCRDAAERSAAPSPRHRKEPIECLEPKKKKDQLALAQYGDKLFCEQARS